MNNLHEGFAMIAFAILMYFIGMSLLGTDFLYQAFFMTFGTSGRRAGARNNLLKTCNIILFK